MQTKLECALLDGEDAYKTIDHLEKDLAIAGKRIIDNKYKVLQAQNESLQSLVNDHAQQICDLKAMNNTQTEVANKLKNSVSENTLKHEKGIKKNNKCI